MSPHRAPTVPGSQDHSSPLAVPLAGAGERELPSGPLPLQEGPAEAVSGAAAAADAPRGGLHQVHHAKPAAPGQDAHSGKTLSELVRPGGGLACLELRDYPHPA